MSTASQARHDCIYSTLAGDAELAELIELFVVELPQRLAGLTQACDRGDWQLLGRTAHQLKGAVGSYGFHDLNPLAARLEQAARSNEPADEIRRCLEELVDLCRRVRS